MTTTTETPEAQLRTAAKLMRERGRATKFVSSMDPVFAQAVADWLDDEVAVLDALEVQDARWGSDGFTSARGCAGVPEPGSGDAAMKALSVQPPWSWAIAWAGKTVENRTWPTRFRGEVAIRASKKLDKSALEDWRIVEAITRPGTANLRYDFGRIVAVAELVSCHLSPDFGGTCGATRPLCSPWAVRDQYHWVLASVRPLAEPVPARGMLGLWTVPEEAERAIRAQLGDSGD
jgi:hypothetical protein